MKKNGIFLLIALIFITTIVVGIIYFQKPVVSGTAWKYQKVITTPITVIAGKNKEAVLGDVSKDKVTVTIPKNSLDTDHEIHLHTPATVPNYKGEEIDTIGAPIEIGTGIPTRLNEKAAITFSFDPSQITPSTKPSELRIAYYDGTQWSYIRPASVDMKAGMVTFYTYHFSLFGLTKINKTTVLTEQWIHSKTLDDTLRDNVNTVTDETAKQIIDMTMEKMGISDKSLKGKVLSDLLKNDSYKKIYDEYSKNGNSVELNQKIAVLAGSKIAQIVPASTLQSYLKTTTKSTDEIAKVAQAAGYMAEGQYKDAAKIIGEQIADTFVLTTAGKIAVEVVNGQIEGWKNEEVEAAYTAFTHGANGVFYGYNVDKGDFNAIWDQMRGIRRQLEIEAITKINTVRSESGLPPLNDQQMDKVRDDVKASYLKQFTYRAEQEKKFEEDQEKLRKLIDAYNKADFFGSTGPAGLDKGLDYENKLDVLYHFAKKIMKDTGRFEISDKNGLIMDKAIAIDDIVQGARAWFSGPDGKKKYEDFLKTRFNISLAPKLSDLAGKWENGKMTITDVIVPEAVKEAAKDPKNKEEGCDLSIDLESLKGKTFDVALTITPEGESNGTLTFKAQDADEKAVPFSYNDGVIAGSFTEKGAVAVITLPINASEQQYATKGTMIATYKAKAGEIKVIASLTAVKTIQQTLPQVSPQIKEKK